MTTSKISAQELRNSTTSTFVIFWDGVEMSTTKGGAINSRGGIVLSAFIPELNDMIYHRSNGNHGHKGFSLNDNDKALPSEIRNRLEYKY